MQEGGDGFAKSAYVIEEIDYDLATQIKDEFGQISRAVGNCAALDTCCTSFVAGRLWLEMYVEQLGQEERKRGREY